MRQQIPMTVDNLIISIVIEAIKNKTQFGKIMSSINGRRCKKWQRELIILNNFFRTIR